MLRPVSNKGLTFLLSLDGSDTKMVALSPCLSMDISEMITLDPIVLFENSSFVDWDRIYQLSREQTVSALVFDGM